jgi:hypothetical protein
MLLGIFAVIVLAAAGLSWGFTAMWYRKRLDEAEDRAEVARDTAVEALAQLREALRNGFQSAERDSRVLHGFTGPELTILAAYEGELGGSRWRARKFKKFAARAGNADLPQT